jgi:hypothetical protein
MSVRTIWIFFENDSDALAIAAFSDSHMHTAPSLPKRITTTDKTLQTHHVGDSKEPAAVVPEQSSTGVVYNR